MRPGWGSLLPEASPILGQADRNLRIALRWANRLLVLRFVLTLVGALVLAFTSVEEEVGTFYAYTEGTDPSSATP
jgi:hypothetical protein